MAGFFLAINIGMPDFPSQLSLKDYIHHLPSQQNVGCCTASATLLAAEIILSMKGKKINFSRLYLYYMTRKLQGRLGQNGAELKHTVEALSKFGVCTEDKWRFSFNRINMEPNIVAIQDANNYRLVSYEMVSTDQYKEYLNRRTPIIIGMITGRRFWSLYGTFEQQGYKAVNGTDNRQSKGHAVTIIGYNDNLNGGSWIVANSLGVKWGFQGYGAIPYECNSNIGESYAITNFAGITAD